MLETIREYGLERLEQAGEAGELRDRLHDQMTDVIAQAAHEAYLAERRERPDFGSRPADRPWPELSPQHREASEAHGEGIVEQLRAVWYEIEPLYDWHGPPATLEADTIETMAELEHARWCVYQHAKGWRYGPQRSDADKLHNLLVPWKDLLEEDRDYDRVMVSTRPTILAAVGFRLVRDPARERLARELHARYVASRETAGEQPLYALSWEELPEETRESNRAAVDHIAVKLARIGYRIVPRGPGSVERAVFSEDEVEQMAMLEHERWLTEKRAAGMTLGPRDGSAQTHPSMVPWEELPEAEREKDRDVVRAIPDQLISVGYAVVRYG